MGENRHTKRKPMIRSSLLVFIFYISSFAIANASERARVVPEDSDMKIIEEVVKQLEYEDGNFFSEESMVWLEQNRRNLAGDIVALGAYIDSLMGNVDTITYKNRSYIKLYMGARKSKFDDVDMLENIKLRLDLPLTKERLRFVLESDDEDVAKESATILESPAEDDAEENGINATFSYLFQARHWEHLSFDSGIKFRSNPDLFSRARAARRWHLSEKWTFVFNPEAFWFESKGAGVSSYFDFNRVIQGKYLFRVRNATSWYERERAKYYSQKFSFYHDISQFRAIEYTIGWDAKNQDHETLITSYGFVLRYRRDLYKSWLYYQMEMGVSYPREYEFRANPFVGLRFEVLLSDDVNRVFRTSLY